MKRWKKVQSIASILAILCLIVMAARSNEKADEINTVIAITMFVSCLIAISIQLYDDNYQRNLPIKGFFFQEKQNNQNQNDGNNI